MIKAPPFDCEECERRIGKTRTHLLLKDGRLLCIRCYIRGKHSGAAFCSRAYIARVRGLWP